MILTEGELFAVHTILPLMEEYKNTPLESTFKSIISKMMDLLPNKVEINSPINKNDIYFIKDPLPEISEEIFTSVFNAIHQNKSIELLNYADNISAQHEESRRFDTKRAARLLSDGTPM